MEHLGITGANYYTFCAVWRCHKISLCVANTKIRLIPYLFPSNPHQSNAVVAGVCVRTNRLPKTGSMGADSCYVGIKFWNENNLSQRYKRKYKTKRYTQHDPTHTHTKRARAHIHKHIQSHWIQYVEEEDDDEAKETINLGIKLYSIEDNLS